MTHRVASGLVGLALTVLVVATAVRWADLASPWYLIAVQALRWVVAAWCVAALVVVVALRRRIASVVALALVIVHVALAVPAFRAAPAAAPGAGDLVVMAANLELGRADPAALVTAVRDQDVDVLVLLELTPEAADALAAAGLEDLLPEQVLDPAPGPGGSGVLSRFPLRQREVPPSRFAQPAVEVGTGLGPVLVRAAHPTPPVRFPVLWHDELGDLVAWASGETDGDVPVVLAGDLNSSEDHPGFRRLTDVLTDAHAELGRGWVRTWPQGGAVQPFVQLDHVLVDGLPVVDAGTVRLPRTDHAAVWARLGGPGA